MTINENMWMWIIWCSSESYTYLLCRSESLLELWERVQSPAKLVWNEMISMIHLEGTSNWLELTWLIQFLIRVIDVFSNSMRNEKFTHSKNQLNGRLNYFHRGVIEKAILDIFGANQSERILWGDICWVGWSTPESINFEPRHGTSSQVQQIAVLYGRKSQKKETITSNQMDVNWEK